MSDSSIRRKGGKTPPPKGSGGTKANPPWFLPVMLGLMIFGLLWIVVYYISEGAYPIPTVSVGDITWQAGHWNLVIGFVFIMAGFMMTTRWR